MSGDGPMNIQRGGTMRIMFAQCLYVGVQEMYSAVNLHKFELGQGQVSHDDNFDRFISCKPR